jgi:transcriptional regulator with XRE-family HTH domain
VQTPADGPAAAGEPILIPDLPYALAFLDNVRHDQALTCAELAALTPGVSGGQLSEWLNGKHEPGASKLFAIAETLGLRWALIPKIENEDG